MTDPLAPRGGEEYPQEMPLPTWAGDVSAKLRDLDHLVFIEVEDFGGGAALAVAHVHVEEVSQRLEVQPLAVILDSDLQQMTVISADARLYTLADPGSEIARDANQSSPDDEGPDTSSSGELPN